MSENTALLDTAVDVGALVEGGLVKACASKFPVQIWWTAAGEAGAAGEAAGSGRTRGSMRVVFAQVPVPARDEIGTDWVACGWHASVDGSAPVLEFVQRIASFEQLSSAAIVFTGFDGTQYRVKPDGGCACGSRMRGWQPFSGYDAELCAVPRPELPWSAISQKTV